MILFLVVLALFLTGCASTPTRIVCYPPSYGCTRDADGGWSRPWIYVPDPGTVPPLQLPRTPTCITTGNVTRCY